jgi:hypothetical protein
MQQPTTVCKTPLLSQGYFLHVHLAWLHCSIAALGGHAAGELT